MFALGTNEGKTPQDMVEMVEIDIGTSSSEESYNIFVSESDITSLEEEPLEDDIGLDAETIKSMLTFVPFWDPADDVQFLSHHNSDQESLLTARPPLYPSDPLSELQSLNVPSIASSSRTSVCYQSVRKDHESLFYSLNLEQRSLRGMTQTSSTLGGLDVYLKGATLALTHRHQPVYSVLDFGSDFQFDANSMGACDGHPECSYSLRRSVLHLTTSHESSADTWSTIESPTLQEIEHMRNPFDRMKVRHGRRLKKRRPNEAHAPRAKRPSSFSSHSLRCPNQCARLFKGILSIGRHKQLVEEGDWIWVEAQN